MSVNNIDKKENESFEDWSERHEQVLTEIFAETGADRELDFDRESDELRLYNDLCNQISP
jgi:hypothetical protein